MEHGSRHWQRGVGPRSIPPGRAANGRRLWRLGLGLAGCAHGAGVALDMGRWADAVAGATGIADIVVGGVGAVVVGAVVVVVAVAGGGAVVGAAVGAAAAVAAVGVVVAAGLRKSTLLHLG